MRRKFFVFLLIGVAPLAALMFILSSGVLAQDGAASDLLGSDEGPGATPQVIIPERFQPAPGFVSGVGETIVYFSPQDSNGNNTVLFLYNTGSAVGNVQIRGFGFSGAQTISTTVAVPSSGAVRISADTLVAAPAPPPSWMDNVMYVDFTDFTAYARMALPDGIKAEGWVVWSGMTNFDPRADVERLPLRFSTDPPSLFLPVVSDGS